MVKNRVLLKDTHHKILWESNYVIRNYVTILTRRKYYGNVINVRNPFNIITKSVHESEKRVLQCGVDSYRKSVNS